MKLFIHGIVFFRILMRYNNVMSEVNALLFEKLIWKLHKYFNDRMDLAIYI